MKNCPKCNTELPDEAVFCNNCGHNMQEAAPEAPAEPTPAPEAPKEEAPINNEILTEAVTKNKNTQIGMFAIIGGAALVVLILICILIANLSGGPKAPIKQLVKNINKQSTDLSAYAECVLPPFAVNTYDKVYSWTKKNVPDAIEDYNDALKDEFEDLYDGLIDEYGEDYKITIEFRDMERLKDRDIREIGDVYEALFDMIDNNIDLSDDDIYDDLADMIDDEYDISVSSNKMKKLQNILVAFMDNLEDIKITDAYEIEVKLRIEGEEGSDSVKYTVNVIKVNGKWFIDPLDAMEELGFGSFYNLMYYFY